MSCTESKNIFLLKPHLESSCLSVKQVFLLTPYKCFVSKIKNNYEGFSDPIVGPF